MSPDRNLSAVYGHLAHSGTGGAAIVSPGGKVTAKDVHGNNLKAIT